MYNLQNQRRFKMKRYAHLRKKAIELRTKKKMALGDICKRLALSKTTVYYWIKGIPIPRTKRQSNALCKGTRAMQAKYKRIRDNAYNEGKKAAPNLFRDPSFRDFIVVYLCEGYRKTRNTVAVANSNAKILKLSQKYMGQFTSKKIYYKIQMHIDQDEASLKKYWSNVLNINKQEITTIRKSNTGKLARRTWRSEYGVLTIQTHDTYLRTKIQAWMDYLQDLWYI